MAKNKTVETEMSVAKFLQSLDDEARKQDCLLLADIIQKTTGFSSKMWGTAIVGFGSYHYRYDSGREGDAPLVGFSPRKEAIALYLSGTFNQREELLQKFGKHKSGKACIYVKKLSDIDVEILKQMLVNSVKETKRKYP
jgi:Domain of unknown function (DU1801)